MKPIVTFLAAVASIVAGAAPALAQSLDGHAQNALNRLQAATGLPAWALAAIAAVIVIAVIALFARRRPTQAVIKTRLG